MKKNGRIDSKELGLEIGFMISRNFLKTESLHYGYWTDDLTVDLINLPKAQENYDNFIVSNIPKGAKTILDVGCGSGNLALKLINKDYQVDCVSPSSFFAQHAHNLLGDRSHIFTCTYEDLKSGKLYDVILFSESFQYIKLGNALQNSFDLLNKGGYLLICDFFKTDAEGESPLGGGHRLKKFYDSISKYPFKLIKNIDITRETAPNLDIVNEMLKNVAFPIWNLTLNYLNSNYPIMSKVLQWKFRKKINKINLKYFSGQRNAESFAKFKSYRLLLYKKA